MRALGRRAVAAGSAALEVAHLPSRRTEPVRLFIESLGVPLRHGEYHIPVGVALGAAEPREIGSHVAPGRDAAAFYRRAAGAWSTPAGVVRAMARGSNSTGEGAVPFRLPRTHTERWLSEVWRDLLGVDRVGVHDDFFALGGDSLTGARMMGRIRHAFGIQLALPTLYEAPTLEEQAGRLMRARLEHADPNVVRSLLAEDSSRAPA